jgi:hypothetical protein
MVLAYTIIWVLVYLHFFVNGKQPGGGDVEGGDP